MSRIRCYDNLPITHAKQALDVGRILEGKVVVLQVDLYSLLCIYKAIKLNMIDV